MEFVLLLESRLFGLTLTDLRVLAYQLAEKNNLEHNFNATKKMAGKCWLYSFLKRNPELKLRTPEPTSLARAIGFNRTVVNMFFDLLSGLYDQYKFSPDRIYNVDETGIRTVPTKQSKVLALRGKRQAGGLVSEERGQLVTAETCMSASGNYMPIMFVFPRQRAKQELLDDAPPGTTAEYHPSGWMQKDIFVKWFQRFVEFSKPTEEKPVLLLLDGHSTHTKSIELIDVARKNNVILLCFPPHCTHRMQPLDVSFMAPVSHYYSEEVRKWLQSHPGRVVTINQIGKLYGSAFMKAASIETAVNGFRKTGIYPLDRNVFPDWMYEPSETTERPVSSKENEGRNIVQPTPCIGPQVSENRETVQNSEPVSVEPSDKSPRPFDSCGPKPGTSTSDSSFKIPLKDIRAVPQAQRSDDRAKNRRRGKTAILTSSPYKKELEDLKDKSKAKRRIISTDDTPAKKKRRNEKKKTTKKSEKRHQHDSETSDGKDNAACMFCNELFSESKSEEGWIKCTRCNEWAHEECAGIDEEDDGIYICDFCK